MSLVQSPSEYLEGEKIHNIGEGRISIYEAFLVQNGFTALEEFH
jgi:hypothetical protein